MTVLIVAPYIYDKNISEFTINQTGFGIMVKDIFDSLSLKEDVYLTTQVITKGHNRIVKHTWKDVFFTADIKDWIKGFRYFVLQKQSMKNRLKFFYYALNSGSFRKTLRELKPDVVHINGLSVSMKPYIDVCEEENVPFLITLHGLIGLDNTDQASEWDKSFEESFLIYAFNHNVPITVISTGMKKRIEERYLSHKKATNITVICNGTKTPFKQDFTEYKQLDLRGTYKLKDEKIVVVIGTLCKRKNQIQIVKAVSTGIIKTPCHLFFCGADQTNNDIKNMVKRLGLDNRIHFLGFLPHEEIEQILSQSDINVVASVDEGFGLSIIEAFRFGVPTVAFSDIDAIPDLYDERAMILVSERDDCQLAKGIDIGLKMKWNRTWIKEWSRNFSIEKCTDQYRLEYSNVLLKKEPAYKTSK